MSEVLLNQKEVSKRKELRSIQKQSKREYGRGKSIAKAKIGKLIDVEEVQEYAAISNGTRNKPDMEEFLNLLRELQLTGMSGNGFPVYKKIEKIATCQARTLIINGVECEPGLLHDRWLLENHWEEIKGGIQYLQEKLYFDRCILAYSMNRKARRNHEKESICEICHVAAKYPMGEERFLIKQLLGKEISKEEYPTEQGILVLNVQTVFQISNILSGTYQNGRYITAANLDTGKAKIIYAEKGTDIKQKTAEVFGVNTDVPCFAGGGVMSAHKVTDGEVFTDSVCFIAIGTSAEITNEHACKGCGKCNRKCPAGVDIREIVKRREKNPHADITGLGMEKCIHCGCCTFFCRAGKDTLAYFD